MDGQDNFNALLAKSPHPTKPHSEKPHLSRRTFFQLAGAGLTASFLPAKLPASPLITTTGGVTMQNTAKNVIYILLAGAPSHTDTFDLKVVNNVTPKTFNPTTVNGLM